MANEGSDKPADKPEPHEPREPRESASEHAGEREPYGDSARFDEEGPPGRWGRLTRRLIDRGEDARYLLGTVLDTSDKAKTEVVRMVAREVRHYLEALKLEEDIREFLTSHTLEVQASFSLKPIADKVAPAPVPPADDPEEAE